MPVYEIIENEDDVIVDFGSDREYIIPRDIYEELKKIAKTKGLKVDILLEVLEREEYSIRSGKTVKNELIEIHNNYYNSTRRS